MLPGWPGQESTCAGPSGHDQTNKRHNAQVLEYRVPGACPGISCSRNKGCSPAATAGLRVGGHWLAHTAHSGGTGSVPSLVLHIVTVSGPVPESGTVDPGGSHQHSGSF